MKSRFFLLFAFIFILGECGAQIRQGCQATATSGSNSIYYVSDGYNGSVPQFRNDNFTNRYQVSEVYCYSGLAAGHGTCYIQGYGGPASDYGTLVSFSTTPQDCPLDSDVLFLMPALIIFALFRFRKAIPYNPIP